MPKPKRIGDERPYRWPLQESPPASKPLALRGDRGAARPGSTIERQLHDLPYYQRHPPMPADTPTKATGHAIPLQCRGFADALALRPVEDRWTCRHARAKRIGDERPYRWPLQESPRQANPSHCEGIAGRLDPARPSNGSFMTSRISNVTRRCPPTRLQRRQATRSPCNAGGLLSHRPWLPVPWRGSVGILDTLHRLRRCECRSGSKSSAEADYDSHCIRRRSRGNCPKVQEETVPRFKRGLSQAEAAAV
jgi:hypothetical protein